ncbi:MAG: radical protein, partial [Caproiciproducens sp.]|nr:radical protein [Caproiciproducens sp.]
MKIEHCTLCPRNCGVTREETSGSGYCGMGANPVVARAALHFWEEPCISGKRGSGTVFFTGCSLKCVFCQNYQISTEREVGQSVSIEELAEIFDRLVLQGAHNINLVNPTHFAS